ncbi:MAG TPA: hypothetical protein PKC72_16605 [Chitinophagaceae bacterium]|nr:hypothetical protein [Chitinophagaceae bacterium]
MQLILSGSGGYIQVDSSYVGGVADTSGLVEFPNYTPPINNGGMLSFRTMEDYDFFIKSVDLMEDLWKYDNVDYEETPYEIFHLGDESLNAFDSALNFSSLRNKYELNEFNDPNWIDTASLYVEDDDYQIVLNLDHEVKIGEKYYKFINDNIIAEINDNSATLDSVRAMGVFTPGSNFRLYDQLNGTIVSTPEWVEITQGCTDYHLGVSASFGTFLSNGNARWRLNTMNINPLTASQSNYYSNVKARYTVDWGDGNIQILEGYFGLANIFSHVYQYPLTGYQDKTITVSCQLITQSNPSGGYLNLIQDCPDLPNIIFISRITVRLDSYNYPDCLSGRIIRDFNGVTRLVNGELYRVDCKLKQVTETAGFIFNWQRPKIVATIVFRKLKNGKWKKKKSLGELILNLRGNVYRNYDCTNLFYTINETKTKNKKKKIKLSILGKVGTYEYFPSSILTHRYLPIAINADYIWKYNNNQVIVGNYNEVLKP